MAHAAKLSLHGNLLSFVLSNRRRWLPPASAVAAIGLVFAGLRNDTWEASQSLVVRNEAAGNLGEPGRFRHVDEMKTTQETILELARSRAVLRQALVEVGPPADSISDNWPTDQDVTQLVDSIKLVPPKGAEFGKTEVLYLKVRDRDRQRALAIVTAVSKHLQARFQQLRDAKAQGMIAELTKSVSMATGEMTTATDKLATLEQSVGSDLAELRILHESSSGDSDLRRKSLELETELRQAQLVERTQRGLFDLLQAARADQGRLLALPSSLLESQPALKRLKEGLVDAQLKTSDLSGSMSNEHPLVRAALESEAEISRQLHQELEIACRGVQVDLRLADDRVTSLAEQLSDTRSRLAKLGSLRANYSNLIAEVEQRNLLLAASQRELSEARSSQAGAHSSSLIYSIDEPDTGSHPVGPGRLTIAAGGVLGGLLVGAAMLFLALPVPSKPSVELPPVYQMAVTPLPVAPMSRKETAGVSVRKALKKAMTV